MLVHPAMYAENQAEAFQNDAILTQLAQQTTIAFAGFPHARDAERRQEFVAACNRRKLPITVPSNGINLCLELASTTPSATEIAFTSAFVFHGVCVRFTGRINKQSLTGNGSLELDTERAASETVRTAETLLPYRQRIEQIRNMILNNQ
uniref:Transcriptional regulator n=1 Tax=Panagrellus redivivus TaxID=6233 RepID=A0A7E4UQX4_PANRE